MSIPLTRSDPVSAREILAVFLREVAASSDGNDLIAVPEL